MTTETQKQLAQVLMQHLPAGSYDHSHNTLIYKDVMAHSAGLAPIIASADTLLEVINGIPAELLDEFEREYGLPLQCGQTDVGDTVTERIAEIQRVKREGHVLLNLAGLYKLMARYGQSIVSIKNYLPMQCIGSCVDPINSERLRFKVTLTLQKPVTANFECLSTHYLPASLMIDILTV